MKKGAKRSASKNKPIRTVAVIIFVFVLFLAVWLAIRPGVFIVQPNSSYPNGITVIYHSRGSDMDFISSPDAICLKLQGSVSSSCQDLVISALDQVLNRAIVTFP